MTWRRNPSALAAIGKIPADVRTIILVLGMVAAFVILGFVMMSGPVAETDRKIDQLERTQRK